MASKWLVSMSLRNLFSQFDQAQITRWINPMVPHLRWTDAQAVKRFSDDRDRRSGVSHVPGSLHESATEPPTQAGLSDVLWVVARTACTGIVGTRVSAIARTTSRRQE